MDASDLQRRYEVMADRSRDVGAGGLEVLEVAYHTLAAGRAIGRWTDVGLEDLWAHALKEGRTLFEKPETRWSRTGPKQTKDLLGQTTVGPWQMTITNVQKEYGHPYGIHSDWPEAEIFAFIESRPQVQAGMICDYISKSYATLGTRGPLAIQRYFWLRGFVTGEIGQGPWDASVLADPPDGDFKKLTPAMKRETGFYAKQILLGTTYNPRGLLYWLWVTDDHAEIARVLRTWREQRDASWDESEQSAKVIGPRGRFAIAESDLLYVPDEWCREVIKTHLGERMKDEG